MKDLFAIVFLCLCATQASADSMETILERGIIEVAVYKDFPPYSYTENGKPQGIDVDIANEVAKKLGVRAIFRMVGADENMSDDLRNNVWKGHYLGGGTADMMMHVPYHPEYSSEEDLVLFLTPYYEERIVFAYDTEQIPPPTGLEPFLKHKVGVELDTLADFILLGSMQGKLIRNVLHYRTVSQAVEGMKNSETTAVLAPRGELEVALSGEERYKIVDVALPKFSQRIWNLGVGVKFTNTALGENLEQAIRELEASGEIEQVFNRYGISYQPPGS